MKKANRIIRTCFLLFYVILFHLPEYALSQGVTQLKFNFAPGIVYNTLEMEFDNGREKYKIAPVALRNHFLIRERFYTEYAAVTISCSGDSNIIYSKTFFVSQKPATVQFVKHPKSGDNPLDKFNAINATEIYQTPGGRKLLRNHKKDYDNLIAAYLKIGNEAYNQDSLQHLLHYYDSIIVKKDEYFIRHNTGDYFSLWYFKERIIPSYFFYLPDTINNMFMKSFSTANRQTKLGKEIMKIVRGRLLKGGLSTAPLFTSRDNTGQTLSLGGLRGQYVLLSFWASWCMPCIEEMPMLKKIRAENDSSFIQIISVSIDSDSQEFKKAIDKYGMNWIHIFNDRELINCYGNTPIPALYLIDPSGKIIYNRFEQSGEGLLRLIDSLKKPAGSAPSVLTGQHE